VRTCSGNEATESVQLSRLQTLKNPLTVAVHLPLQLPHENRFIHLGTSILREVRWRGLDSFVEAQHRDPLLLRALLPPEMLTSSALEPFHLHLEALSTRAAEESIDWEPTPCV